ncbi:MAG: 23S rRNA (adenine(2030)-N(6))-methyltransferase RlmJ, partial [Pontibacterium sp.]
MLSYQHHFHAGNHGDVIKHWLLIECLTYLQQKDKPFDYIDTHAGAGLYDLTSSKATKTQESHAGVLRLDWSSLPALTNYHDAIHDDLAQVKYPGSPLLVKRTLRQGDKAWLFEMHPQTIVELRQHCAEKRLSYVQEEDGFQGLLRLLPNKSRRALVLIDPSYEI